MALTEAEAMTEAELLEDFTADLIPYDMYGDDPVFHKRALLGGEAYIPSIVEKLTEIQHKHDLYLFKLMERLAAAEDDKRTEGI